MRGLSSRRAKGSERFSTGASDRHLTHSILYNLYRDYIIIYYIKYIILAVIYMIYNYMMIYHSRYSTIHGPKWSTPD